MAEPVALLLGALSLAPIFFDLIDKGRSLGTDFSLLQQRLFLLRACTMRLPNTRDFKIGIFAAFKDPSICDLTSQLERWGG
jgi:hypothetical protein